MSESCCCIDDVDYQATVHRAEIRHARKTHKCVECGDLIQPGQQYEHVAGLWDGHWDTHRTCGFCLKIRRDFFPCGWYYGTMRDDFKDCMGWDYTATVEELEDDDDE